MNTSLPHHPFSKIKDIYIEVCQCKFHHSYLGGEQDDIFIGRGKAKRRLRMILEKSTSESGAYLVTGFRGMGKTSLVHLVLDEINAKNKDRSKIEKITISLSQDEISEDDVLRQIARQLTYSWRNMQQNSRWYTAGPILGAILGFIILILAVMVAGDHVLRAFQYLLRHQSNMLFALVAFAVATALSMLLVEGIRRSYQKIIGVSYLQILKRLEFLNQRLDAQIEREKGNSIEPEIESSGWLKLRLFSNNERNSELYSLASSKEIEKELIGILHEISLYRNHKDSKWWNKCIPRMIKEVPKFVFVLDELDKIQPDFISGGNGNKMHNSLTLARQRRESVGRLLANLKSFLNEAKAKFIFIGGREMYDASLADIADRESFYSSIFHDVIYVNSFFKDKIYYRSGVSRLTEAYICKLIIPDRYAHDYFQEYQKEMLGQAQPEHQTEVYNLNTLYNYLTDLHNAPGEKKYTKAVLTNEQWEAKWRIYKIIYLLQNFIIYLNYRTNGTPKKLTALIEQFIIPYESAPKGKKNQTKGFWETDHAVIVNTHQNPGPDHEQHPFLKFNFNQQYEIGLTSNLYRPYVLIHSRYLKSLGDKMLYSTAFIMDFILKFHPHGFSWRNLEMIPDAILTNKDPNLRYFMRDLMSFLTLMHVRETVNGMFRFKFYSKIANEIRYLSRISELGSAAFNFTLDESQQIKFLYTQRLHELQEQHRSSSLQVSAFNTVSESDDFVYSIHFLHDIIGDLHYFDKEYDEAIIQYSDALQPLRQKSLKESSLTIDQTVIYTRGLLKLCMALEKLQLFDQAYATYRSLIEELPSLLLTHSGKLQGNHKMESINEEEDPEGRPLRRMQLFLRPYIAILDLIEKQRLEGITFANLRRNLINLNLLFDPERITPFTPESAASLQNSNKDVTRLNTLYSDYFNHVGSILYFKNTNFQEVFESFKPLLPEKYRKGDMQDFLKTLRGGEKDSDLDHNPPITAYCYYIQSLEDFTHSFESQLEGIFGASSKADNVFVRSSRLLESRSNHLVNTMQLYTLGNLYAKLGDVVLSSCGHQVPSISADVLHLYYLPDTSGQYTSCLESCRNLVKSKNFPFENCIDSALVLYRIAGLFYLRANRTYSYGLHMKKFLFVFKDWLESDKGQTNKDGQADQEEASNKENQVERLNRELSKKISQEESGNRDDIGKCPIAEVLMDHVAVKCLSIISWSADISNRPQILKYRDIFNLERTQDTMSVYHNVSTSAEAREVVILVENILLKLKKHKLAAPEPNMKFLLTPYDQIMSRYLRMLELTFKSEFNFQKLQETKSGADQLLREIYHKLPESEISADAVSFWKEISAIGNKNYVISLTLDSIFCLNEIIRTINIYGINYITNHSYLANAHYKLANWCRAFENCVYLDYIVQTKESMKSSDKQTHRKQYVQKLIELLGTDAVYSLEPNYHDEQALQHFYAAIQTHNGGRAYRDNIMSMSFLEDDFNDNLTHFSAATERYRINTGTIRKKIIDLKKQINRSQLYQYDSYRNMPDAGNVDISLEGKFGF